MSRTNKAVKLSQDHSAIVTRVHWTDEEREQLFMHLLKQFQDKNLEMSLWRVNARMIMIAQLAVIHEDRFRETLGIETIERMQEMFDGYIVLHEGEGIVKAHKLYIETHGVTPIAHAFDLGRQLTASQDSKGELIAELASVRAELETANRQAALDTSMIQSLNARLDGKSTLSLVKTTVPTAADDKPKMANISVMIAAPRLPKDAMDLATKLFLNVTTLKATDKGRDIGRKAVGKHVIAVEDQLNAQAMKELRTNGDSYVQVHGATTALIRAMLSLAKEHLDVTEQEVLGVRKTHGL